MVDIIQTASGGNTISSYELLGQVQVILDPVIFTNTPLDTPLMSGLNSDGFPIVGSGPLQSRVYWFQEEDIPTPRARLNGSLANEAGPSNMDVEAGEASKFAVGDALLIDNEIVVVNSMTDANTLVVARAQGGTSAALHADNSDIIGLGSLVAEGDIGGGVVTDRWKNFNYSKIFSRSLGFTRTAQIIPKVGVPSELAKQMFANQHSIIQSIEQALLYARRWNDVASEKRSFGGVFNMAVSNVDNATTTLSVTAIETAQENLFINGHAAGSLWSHPVNFKGLNDVANTNIVRVTFDDARRGRQRVQYVETEYGSVALHRNRWMRTTDGFLAPDGTAGAGMKKLTMTPLVLEKTAKTKDKDEWFMVTEIGFELRGQRAFQLFTALNGSVRISTPMGAEVVPAAHYHGEFQGPSGYETDYPS